MTVYRPPFHVLCDWCTSPYARLEVPEAPGLFFCDEQCFTEWWTSQWEMQQ